MALFRFTVWILRLGAGDLWLLGFKAEGMALFRFTVCGLDFTVGGRASRVQG